MHSPLFTSHTTEPLTVKPIDKSFYRRRDGKSKICSASQISGNIGTPKFLLSVLPAGSWKSEAVGNRRMIEIDVHKHLQLHDAVGSIITIISFLNPTKICGIFSVTTLIGKSVDVALLIVS